MKGFYIDIEAILDARFGAVKRLCPETANTMIRKGYHQRKGDFFEGIKKEDYDELIDKREVETLLESTITNIFQFLMPQVAEHLKEAVVHEIPRHLLPKLDVNVWPYEFTDEEKKDLSKLVYRKLGRTIGVSVFSKPLEELNPTFCNENYVMMIMYRYHDYLNAHSSSLIREPKPTLILIAPMVYFNTNPDEDDEVIEKLKLGLNGLAFLEAAVAPRIHLKFINVENFSIVYPDDRIVAKDMINTDNMMTIEELDQKFLAEKAKRGEV